MEQWNRQSALLQQLRTARQAPQVDRDVAVLRPPAAAGGGRRAGHPASARPPGCGRSAHRRLAQRADLADLLSLPTGRPYEEEIAGRRVSGEVVVRRSGHHPRTARCNASKRRKASSTATRARGEWHQRRSSHGDWPAARARPCARTAPAKARTARLGTDPHGTRRRADKHLPDIAGLIDPEQFELITRPSAGFVVIRGTAGSGKTTVALHRIAYLAYEDPAHRLGADAGGRVLAGAARLRQPRAAGARRAPRAGPHLPGVGRRAEPAALPEAARQRREDTPALVQRLKLHPALLVASERQVSAHAGQGDARAGDRRLGERAYARSAARRKCSTRVAPGAFRHGRARLRASTWNRGRYEELTACLKGDQEAQRRARSGG